MRSSLEKSRYSGYPATYSGLKYNGQGNQNTTPSGRPFRSQDGGSVYPTGSMSYCTMSSDQTMRLDHSGKTANGAGERISNETDSHLRNNNNIGVRDG